MPCLRKPKAHTHTHTHLTAVEVMGVIDYYLLVVIYTGCCVDCPMNNVQKKKRDKKCWQLEKEERKRERGRQRVQGKVYKVGSGLLHR